MKKYTFLLFWAISFNAVSQNVLLSEDFESGTLGQFVAGNNFNGITWQTTTNRGSDPGHSAINSAYFGDLVNFNYDSGDHEMATLTSGPIDVSSGNELFLSFNYFLEAQAAQSFDIAFVQLSKDGVKYYTVADNAGMGQLVQGSGNWENVQLNLTQFSGNSYGGTDLYIRFMFNTVDANNNQFEGFYVDDVELLEVTTDFYARTIGKFSLSAEQVGSSLAQDGNFLSHMSSDNQTPYILKIDPVSGLPIWTSELQDRYNIHEVVELVNGDIVAVGSFKENHGGGLDTTSAALVFLGPNASSFDQRHLFKPTGIMNTNFLGSFLAIDELTNGNLVAVGNVHIDGVSGQSYRPNIVCMDNSGAVQWSKTIDFSTSHDVSFEDVIATQDGGCLAIGNRMSTGSAPYIYKFNALGNIEWHSRYGNNGRVSKGIENSDGTFLLVGRNGTNASFDPNALIWKIDALGNVLWSNSYSNSILAEHLTDVEATANGTYVFSGYMVDQLKDTCMLFGEIDGLGNLLWNRAMGGNGVEKGHSIMSAGNDYVVSGTTNSFDANGDHKFCVFKIDSVGQHLNCVVSSALTSNVISVSTSTPFITEITSYRQEMSASGTVSNSPLFADDIDLSATFQANAIDCNGGVSDILTTVVGTPAFAYEWSTGSISKDLYNVQAGYYQQLITDGFGCAVESEIYLPEPGPISYDLTINEPLCNGDTGSIYLDVFGGIPTYTFHWSNSQSTQNLLGVNSGFYQLTILDDNSCSATTSVSLNEPSAISVGITSSQNVSCHGLCDGELMAIASGGTGAIDFLWNDQNNQVTTQASALCPGNYLVTATDVNGCSSFASASILEPDPLTVMISTTGSECGLNNGTATATYGGGTGVVSYAWSTGGNASLESNIASGNHSLTISDANSCMLTEHFIISDSIQDVSLCVISVDTSGKNLCVWGKPSSANIAGFNIYREVGGSYAQVDFVPYDSLSQWVDQSPIVDPNTTSYRYKISVLDTCGNEGNLSEFHETMHLTSNQGISGEVNLIWDTYEGFSYNQYYILKDTVGNGNYFVLDSVSNFSFTYTDFNQVTNATYSIEVQAPNQCTSTRANHNTTRSNKTQPINNPGNGNDVLEILSREVKLFPNPARHDLFYDLNEAYNQTRQIQVLDINGRLMVNIEPSEKGRIDVSEYATGMYFLRIVGVSGTMNFKFVKR